jgi:putative ABC transport system permease protein
MRHRLRSALTIASVAAGLFLFTAVEIMQVSLRRATEQGADDTTLVVYRENRFCPATSRLPEYYLSDIRRIKGVREAIPVQIVVNNCGASLDVITFRGVPPEDLVSFNPDLEIVAGSLEEWKQRDDGALLGEHFAARRRLKLGDQFEAVGVRVVVSAIIRSPLSQDNNVAYVHLPFLQQASRRGLGVVTQFNVHAQSGEDLEAVAQRIDGYFASDAEPTHTQPEKAFFAQTAQDMIEIIRFTRWLGLGAVLGVFGLVANALLLVARGRMRENAIFETVGFPKTAVATILVFEGALLGLAGGALGSLGAALFFQWNRFTLGNEGLTLALTPDAGVVAAALGIGLVTGVAAALWPALVATRNGIVTSLKSP